MHPWCVGLVKTVLVKKILLIGPNSSQGFGWVNLEKADQFRSYLFRHHEVQDDIFHIVWNGLAEAMADVLSDQSRVDAKEVYEHLARHYAEFGNAAPEWKEYTSEELEIIRSGQAVVKESPVQEDAITEKETETEAADVDAAELKFWMESHFSQVKDQVSELEDTVRLRMSIRVRCLMSYKKNWLNQNRKNSRRKS